MGKIECNDLQLSKAHIRLTMKHSKHMKCLKWHFEFDSSERS